MSLKTDFYDVFTILFKLNMLLNYCAGSKFIQNDCPRNIQRFKVQENSQYMERKVFRKII